MVFKMNLSFVQEFIKIYPEFRIQPVLNDIIIIKGRFTRILNHETHGKVYIDYSLSIHVPYDYPNQLPEIYEESGLIVNDPSNHVNYDGSFCLGAPIRLKLIIKKNASLTHFFEESVLPYLYAVTLKNNMGKNFIFGELEHGNRGLIDDYKSFFHLHENSQVYQMLGILSSPKKEGNKLFCPCGCKKRVTTCNYFKKVVLMRKLFKRTEWKSQLNLLQ